MQQRIVTAKACAKGVYPLLRLREENDHSEENDGLREENDACCAGTTAAVLVHGLEQLPRVAPRLVEHPIPDLPSGRVSGISTWRNKKANKRP